MTELTIDTPHWAGDVAPGISEVPRLLAPIQLRLAPPTALLAINRLLWPAALTFAVLAHAALIYILIRHPAELMAGGGGQQLDAISVTIVSSSVLESRNQDRSQPSAAAANATVEAEEGAPESPPAAAAEKREEKKEKEKDPKDREKRQEGPVRTVDAILEVPKEARPQAQQRSPAAPAAGGAAARGDATVPAKTSAPAAASAGAVREYARYVSLALGKAKPKGAGGLGTVRIKFVIAADGSLGSAEIAKSSGSSKLDAMALEALRHARFPVPPAGMSVAQLTYEVPYHFR